MGGISLIAKMPIETRTKTRTVNFQMKKWSLRFSLEDLQDVVHTPMNVIGASDRNSGLSTKNPKKYLRKRLYNKVYHKMVSDSKKSHTKHEFTNETILQALNEYLAGGARKAEIIKKYGRINNWNIEKVTMKWEYSERDTDYEYVIRMLGWDSEPEKGRMWFGVNFYGFIRRLGSCEYREMERLKINQYQREYYRRKKQERLQNN